MQHATASAVVREAADSCIRMLGKRRRIDTHRATVDDPRLPKYARDYLEAVAVLNGRIPADFERDVTDLLAAAGVFDQGLLLFRGLFAADAGDTYYECARCSRIHLHASGGICSGCQNRLRASEGDDLLHAEIERAMEMSLRWAEARSRATASACSRTSRSAPKCRSPTISTS